MKTQKDYQAPEIRGLGGMQLKIQGTRNNQWFETHRSGSKFEYLIEGFTPYQEYRVSLGFAEIIKTVRRESASWMSLSRARLC